MRLIIKSGNSIASGAFILLRAIGAVALIKTRGPAREACKRRELSELM
jgi:hypothetical protein